MSTSATHATIARVDIVGPRRSMSIIIVNANGRHHLARSLPSLHAAIVASPDLACEVVVVDNASTDGSTDYVAQAFPWVRLIRNDANLGYAQANNIGFVETSGAFVAVLNPDTWVEPHWLRELVDALEADSTAGLATPKILLMQNPARLNACGNQITLTGLTFCRGLDLPADRYNRLEVVPAVSGAAFVIKREVLERIGGFDEPFFMYYEDTDLSLRAMLAGYTCLYVPTSMVYHQYVFKFSARKCFLQERNRYFSLLKTLRWRTLLALLPLLLVSELLTWGYVLLQGREHVCSKLRSYSWLLANRRIVLQGRRQVQVLRRVDDRVLLARFGHRLTLARTLRPGLTTILEKGINLPLFLLAQVSRAIVTW